VSTLEHNGAQPPGYFARCFQNTARLGTHDAPGNSVEG
jgi:hypothetical protein